MKAEDLAAGLFFGFWIIALSIGIFLKVFSNGPLDTSGFRSESMLTCYADGRVVYVGRADESTTRVTRYEVIRFVGEDGLLYEIFRGSCYSTRRLREKAPEAKP